MKLTPNYIAMLLILGTVFGIIDTVYYCFYFLPEFFGDELDFILYVFTIDGAIAYFKSAIGLTLTTLAILPYVICYLTLKPPAPVKPSEFEKK